MSNSYIYLWNLPLEIILKWHIPPRFFPIIPCSRETGQSRIIVHPVSLDRNFISITSSMLISVSSLLLVLINVWNNFISVCCFYGVDQFNCGFQRVFSQSQHEFIPFVSEVFGIELIALEQRQFSLLSLISTAWQISRKSNLNQAHKRWMVACNALNFLCCQIQALKFVFRQDFR